MAAESFEDQATADYLNEHFVSVKVDREERPDVDAVYMEAVQAATGQGGWPMTVFLVPDAEPFYFGTYFPPAPRHGMPSFRQVLEGVQQAWATRREEVTDVAGKIVRDLAHREISYGDTQPPGEEELARALLGLTREYDPQRGGFSGAPKFPPSMVIEFLLRHHARAGSEGALQMARDTCERMARGGIYDQLGGGFARYSVDRDWVVPHFEKMLYDNALLCRVYTHLWRATGSALARRVALETADFMVRELRTAEGGFASALDADSEEEVSRDGGPPGRSPGERLQKDGDGRRVTGTGEHVEGAYYVWTPGQLREALGPEDAELAAQYFGVTEEGTFEKGSSVLQLPYQEGVFDAQRVESIRRRLLGRRAERPAPGRDDKVVAAWNGLAVAALAETGACLDRPDLVEAAVGAADLLVRLHMDEHAGLSRTSRDGQAGANAGVLEDYADVAEGFLALASVTGEGVWLDFAGLLLGHVLTRFADPESGALHDTAADAEKLIRRPQDPTDNATPSGWSAAAGALLGYAAHTGSEAHRTAAEKALGVVRVLGSRVPRFVGWGLAVAEALLDGPREVAVVTPSLHDEGGKALHRTALLGTAPGAVVAYGTPESDEFPLLTHRPLVGAAPTAYVCRNFTCDAPTTDPERLRAALTG